MSKTKNLVIVESPAKAKTISKFLGADYTVLASMGHTRDLPKSTLGFDPEDNFKPKYQVAKDKSKIIAQLKKEIDKDTVIYLAADEDREGESIAWHLIYALKIEKNTLKRIVFHEITKGAILESIKNPRQIDQHLVDSQQARRILDRAVGYKLSPLLWKKVKYGLSAGRVQSVAVRIIVEKEKEIRAFQPQEFWKIQANFQEPQLEAQLAKINGKVTKVTNADDANKIKASCDNSDYVLEDIEEKKSKRKPSAPFTTSTLQQEASTKLGYSVKQTMIIAQQLYEGNVSNIPNHTGGLITYMRTDSLTLSNTALDMAKKAILQQYGSEYTLPKPRYYKNKNKNAQEAHEAIRPVDLQLKPQDVKGYLDNSQFLLYSLIYKRTIATQMADASVSNTTYKIMSGENKEYEFQAKGTKILFPGFMKAYIQHDDMQNLSNQETILPTIEQNTKLQIQNLDLEQKFTKPPARFTEASLVKKLEAEGIGRPSTYAPTITTIQTREYVVKNEDKRLQSTMIGEVVNDFLVENFPDIVSLDFTAKIEERFDEIAMGNLQWQDVMHGFYKDFVAKVDHIDEHFPRVQYSDAKELGVDPTTNLMVISKTGQYGPFVQLGEKDVEKKIKPKMSSIPKNISIEKITLEQALVLLSLPKVLGVDADENDVKVNVGRFGPYIQIKSEYFSLKEDDPYTVELTRALEVVDMIKAQKAKALLKEFKEEEIQIIVGRFGPYIKFEKNNYKLPKTLDEQDIRNLTLKQVQDIIKEQPKNKRGRAKKAVKKTVKKAPVKKATTTKKTATKKTTTTTTKKATTAKKTAVKKTTTKKKATKNEE